jgi:hypothetical protein
VCRRPPGPATVVPLSPLLQAQCCLPIRAPSLPYFFPPALSGAPPPPCLCCCSPPPTASPGHRFHHGHAWALLGPSPRRQPVAPPMCLITELQSNHHSLCRTFNFFPITIFIGSRRPHRACPLSRPPVPQLDACWPWSRAREALEQEAPRGTVSPGHTTSLKCHLRSSSRSAKKIPLPRCHSNTPS